ncbi:MAG: alpha/beta hydrolase [Planctomycetes bacterium]|nr:alpha/beta hydrolase [Planctomycetota bacterium]
MQFLRRKVVLCLLFLFVVFPVNAGSGNKQKVRENIIKLLRSSKMNKELDGAVTVTADRVGLLCIRDPGNYFTQYIIATPDSRIATDPNVIIDAGVTVPVSVTRAVIVTHGWIDKGAKDWPADIAGAICDKVDPNEWVCCYFDWKAGAIVLNPVDAVRYSRDIAAPRLVKAFLAMLPEPARLEHVHIIAHSAGTWAATIAGEEIAKATGAGVHLTLLDSYIPPNWDTSQMGHVPSAANLYVENYFSRDITLSATQHNLANAHNIDLTKTQPGLKTHEFPYKWYYATITGKFRKKDHIKSKPIFTSADGVAYGFTRALETGQDNFCKSQDMKKSTNPVELKRPVKKSIFNIATWFK